MTIIRADSGRMLRKSFRSDCRAISASAPASSTPVGPPPTITNVRNRRCQRQRRRGHLVQQRLEEMVVVTIDERHMDVGATEGPRGVKAAEAAANDYDFTRVHAEP